MNRTIAFLLGFLTASLLGALWLGLRDDDGDGTVLTQPSSFAEKLTRWRVKADPASGRITLGRDGVDRAPVWKLAPGWFVLVESDERAWWFNGSDGLVLMRFETPGELVIHGADSAPGAPPEKLLRRIGQRRFEQIAGASAESKRRLGIGP